MYSLLPRRKTLTVVGKKNPSEINIGIIVPKKWTGKMDKRDIIFSNQLLRNLS